MMFALGFIAAVILMFVAGKLATKYALKKRWYASAIWSEKDQMWKVRGHYLSIGNKIFNGIKHEHATGHKSVKYIE